LGCYETLYGSVDDGFRQEATKTQQKQQKARKMMVVI
jgi:hypothetical protein